MNKRHSPQFTKEGFENLEKEFKTLQEKRKEAVEQLSFARSQGDLSENSAYKVARQKLSSIDSRSRYLSTLLRFGQIVEKPPQGEVGIGSTVTVKNESGETTYIIVGGHESDIRNGKISCFSPIGKALMRKKVGDTVLIHVPAGKITYTITSIGS